MRNMPDRPGGILTAAVLMIVFGTLMLLCGVCGGIGQFTGDAEDEALFAKEAPFYHAVKVADLASDVLVGFGMIAAAAGVLHLYKIARQAAFVFATFEMLITLARTAYNTMFIFPTLARLFAEDPGNRDMPFDPELGFHVFVGCAVTLEIVIKLAFVGAIVALLRNDRVKSAFDHPAEPDDSLPEPGRRRYDDTLDDDYYPPPRPPIAPGDTGFTERP